VGLPCRAPCARRRGSIATCRPSWSLGTPYNGRLLGGSGFISERVTAWEVGWRAQPTPRLSYSINAYYNDWTRLRSAEPVGSDFMLGNGVEGHSAGAEGWGSWQVDDAWACQRRVHAARRAPAVRGRQSRPRHARCGQQRPRHQLQLRASWTGPRRVAFDLAVRHVGALPAPPVPSYTAFDARLAWNPQPGLELSLAGLQPVRPGPCRVRSRADAQRDRTPLRREVSWAL
jgi:iron complex outermembrane receptor protein